MVFMYLIIIENIVIYYFMVNYVLKCFRSKDVLILILIGCYLNYVIKMKVDMI